MRPKNYTNFDPDKDFMFVVDAQREKRINNLLARTTQKPTGLISTDDKRQDLILQRDNCRVRKTVLKKDFDENMSAFSEKLADKIFNRMRRIDTVEKLDVFERNMDMLALRSHRHPDFFETEFSDFVPEITEAEPDRRKDFLKNGSVILYALVQKFIRIRKREL